MTDVTNPRGSTDDRGDLDEAPSRPRTEVAWWKRLLVWLTAGIGAGILLFGLIQLLPLLPMLIVPDDRAGGAGPALFLVLLGGFVFGVAMLVRWALSRGLRR